MAAATLAQISPASKQWVITARIARLWHYRGGTDTGNIQHTDLVLLDEKGTAMYAEIAENYVDSFIDLLQEGGVYCLRKFVVSHPKKSFKPVQARYMIRFTKFTVVSLIDPVTEGFPLLTFTLTPFNDLPSHVGTPEYFVDVVGAITGVSDLAQVRPAAHQGVSSMRTLTLQDSRGRELRLVLWGKCAESFNADAVHSIGQEELVVGIFVGTLVKRFEGERGLSGGSACRYYINEDISEINVYRAKLQDSFEPVKKLFVAASSATQSVGAEPLEDRSVRELLDMDYFDHENTRFLCTITVTRLSPGQSWWFCACNGCNKSAIVRACQFCCADQGCDSVDAEPKYKICVMGSEDTGEAEFVLFGKIGQSVLRKPIMSLLGAGHSRHASLVDIVQAAQRKNEIPADVARIVAQKFRFEVSVSEKSFTADEPSFQVHRIDTFYGKQLGSSAFHVEAGSSGSSRLRGSPTASKAIANQGSQFKTSAVLPLSPYGKLGVSESGSGGLADPAAIETCVDDGLDKTPLCTAGSHVRLSGPIKPSGDKTPTSRLLFGPSDQKHAGPVVSDDAAITVEEMQAEPTPGFDHTPPDPNAALPKRPADEPPLNLPPSKTGKKGGQGKKSK